MSVKIKVSYTEEQELVEIVRMLKPKIKTWKTQPANGKYKRAYIVLREDSRSKGLMV